MTEKLKALFARRGLKIGGAQVQRLSQVLGECNQVTAWAEAQDISDGATVVVDEPPSPPQVDVLRRSLSPHATVIIPFSENPAFDHLKSKLRCHGVIGATAPESPHHIWWGGKTVAEPANCLDAIRQSHVVTCVRPNTHQDANAALFGKGLDILDISYTIERNEAFVHCDDKPDIRSRLLLAAWESSDKPLIWLDPVSNSDLSTISFNIRGADFAAMTSSAGLLTSLLYFGRSEAAFDLLKAWNALCLEYPALPADYLLDAAWALISSQRPLATNWLPSQGAKPTIDRTTSQSAPVFEQYMLTTPSQRQARRASRTGAPEPHCVMKSAFGDRGPLMLITTSQGSTAHDLAKTIQSATAAFAENDGGFSTLGIMICQSNKEVTDTIRLTTGGWILYVMPGLVLEQDVFEKLSRQCEADHPVFIIPEAVQQRQTATGVAIQATRARAIFGRAVTFVAGRVYQMARQPPILSLVS